MKKSIAILSACTITLILGLVSAVGFHNWTITPGQLNTFELSQNNHGVYQEYYPSGQLKSLDTYSKGLRNGVSIQFNQNGDTTQLHDYHQGQQHGVAKYFVEGEVLVLTERYQFGELIDREVLNDSLYRYQFLAYETGQSLFEVQCQSCHLDQNLITDWNAVTKVEKQNLDKVHFPDTTNNFFLPLVSSPDYQMILGYLDQEFRVSTIQSSPKIVSRTKRKRLVNK